IWMLSFGATLLPNLCAGNCARFSKYGKVFPLNQFGGCNIYSQPRLLAAHIIYFEATAPCFAKLKAEREISIDRIGEHGLAVFAKTAKESSLSLCLIHMMA